MPGINLAAIGVAAVAAFIVSTIWYMEFERQRRELSGVAAADMKRPPPLKMLGELIRSILLAYVLAYVVIHSGAVGVSGALRIGLVLWVGFPLVLLTGSIMWEGVPWKLAAIHAGDWLAKILVLILNVDLWR